MPNDFEIHEAIANAMANQAGEEEFNELALCIVKGGNVHDCLKKFHNPLNPPKPCSNEYISYVNDLMIRCVKLMRDETAKKLKVMDDVLGRLQKSRR
jgi:hypothetical protein